MENYNFKIVEKKWQDKWYNEKSFKAMMNGLIKMCPNP